MSNEPEQLDNSAITNTFIYRIMNTMIALWQADNDEGAIGRRYDKKSQQICYYCGTLPEKISKWHIEHIMPRSKGGENLSYNLVYVCPSCNYHKNSNLPYLPNCDELQNIPDDLAIDFLARLLLAWARIYVNTVSFQGATRAFVDYAQKVTAMAALLEKS